MAYPFDIQTQAANAVPARPAVLRASLVSRRSLRASRRAMRAV